MEEQLQSNLETTASAPGDDVSGQADRQPAPKAAVEKRKAVRYKVRWRALVLMGNGTKLPAYIMDVSDGGVNIVSNQPLIPNTRTNLAVYVPDPSSPGTYAPTVVTVNVLYQVLRGAEFAHGAAFHEPSRVFLDRMGVALQRELIA